MVSNKQSPELKGRFLHITDMHPDPYYQPGTSVARACHRKKPKKKKNQSAYYGTPYEGCDSPFSLTNVTIDFLGTSWSSDIDFVIWTGDNARHDNDRKLPRTTAEIYGLNRAMVAAMEEAFLSKGIPVIPSIGNNDVWRPNSITLEYSSIWKKFIPFQYLQVFQRGGYYSVEVIPNHVAVISLNTMYFYDSNKAVGGCEFKDKDDPGNLQLDWLDVQLQLFRGRNMQYVRYVELSLRFQDTILGHLFGHMNNDHFFFLEANELDPPAPDSDDSEDNTNVSAHTGLYEGLVSEFARIPPKKETKVNEYVVINVSPSVVPNPYLPSFRIFSYNITGAADLLASGAKSKRRGEPKAEIEPERTIVESQRDHGHKHGDRSIKKQYCKDNKNTWICHFDEPWHASKGSPSRTNTLWTPLGYAQYYIPADVLHDSKDKKHKPTFKLEYLTFRPSDLHPSSDSSDGETGNTADFEELKDEAWTPIPMRHLPKSLRNSTVTKSKYAPYRMPDLTIGSWVKLARKLGNPTKEKLRNKFKKYMYLGNVP
ncbi:endopolyphosphatase [Fistulina hepatica ATCC 64428]|nr:endopolyphosphatase [Fistulina hepatica ATCC 64428]